MDQEDEQGRRPYRKLSAEERARFLEVLRKTGNRRFAAEAIGVECRLMDQRREHDPELDRAWEEAAEGAHRRLSGADGPFDCAQGRLSVIRRGKKGRLQLVAGGEGRWSAEVEERFKAALRESGNVRAAARAVGFSEGTVWQRRRQWPAFARMLEEMLEEAELALEFRIASMGSNVVGEGEEGREGAGDRPFDLAQDGLGIEQGKRDSRFRGNDGFEPLPFDPDFAMRFLKWREEKRRGRGRWAPRAKPPSIEAVTDKIVRRVEAIKRHRRREAE
jgi:hypothetical protein